MSRVLFNLLFVGALSAGLASVAYAQRVRLTLQDDQVVEGDLVEHRARIYRVKVGETVKEFREKQVKRVDFLQPTHKIVDVDANDEPLSKVIASIVRQSGAAVTVDPAVANERVTIMMKQVAWFEAVDVIAKMTRCDLEQVGGTIYVTRVPIVTLRAFGSDVRVVLKQLAKATGQNIVLGPKVRGRITISLKETRWREAVNAIAWASALDVVHEPGATRITSRPKNSRGAPPPFRERKAPKRKGPTKRISVDFKNTDLSEAMESVGMQARQNILVDPSVQETLSLTLDKTPWRQVVQVAARMTQCRLEERAGGILILSQASRNELHASKAPAAHLFELVASYEGMNVVVAPEVRDPVDADLRRFFWDEAMGTIARANGFTVTEVPGGIWVITGKTYDPNAKGSMIQIPPPRLVPSTADLQKDLQSAQELLREVARLRKGRFDPAQLALRLALIRTALAAPLMDKATRSSAEREYARLVETYTTLGEAMARRVALDEGQLYLTSLSKSTKAKDWDQANKAHAALLLLVQQLESSKDENLRDQGTLLGKRGERLHLEATDKAQLDRVKKHYRLEAVILTDPGADSSSAALIGGAVYRQGDVVRRSGIELKVTRITANSVSLRGRSTAETTLTLE